MPITPDTKDWTKVLDAPCAECGFDAATVAIPATGTMLRTNAVQWQQILEMDERTVRRRPTSQTWSPLEYACHVRDVIRVFDERLHCILSEDAPRFANWDQDATAVEQRYADQQPAEVARDLAAAAGGLAARFDTVSESDWDRSGVRSNGAVLTVAGLARLLTHEARHHLADVSHAVDTNLP